MLLSYPIDPSVYRNYPIERASLHGHADIVRILLQDPRVDPSSNNHCSLRNACRYGHTQIVAMLLDHRRETPNPHDAYREAFRVACCNGHLEVVRMLLTDKRLQLTPTQLQDIVQDIIAHGRVSILRELRSNMLTRHRSMKDLIHCAVARARINILQWV